MDVRWDSRHPQPRGGNFSQDELERVLVGDPDPTLDSGTANRYRKCRFEWADEPSQTMILPWSCSRELGHQGQHIADTGEWVAAMRGSGGSLIGRS